MEGIGTLFSDTPLVMPEWLMEDLIPMAGLTVLVGGPGSGKDHLGPAIIAAVTNGAELPDGSQAPWPGSAILINTEDVSSMTTKPRLMAAGANESKVVDMSRATLGNYRAKFSLGQGPHKPPDDLSLLRQKIRELKDCRLVWISVLNSVAVVNTRNGVTVRDLIVEPLQELALETGVAIVLVHHYVKDGTIGGSQQLEDALRNIVRVKPLTGNQAVRVVTCHKNSIGKTDVTPLRFVIEGERPFSRARFLPADGAELPADEPGEPRPGTLAYSVLKAYRDAHGQPRHASDVAAELDARYDTVRVLIGRLVANGLLRQHRIGRVPKRGVYEAVAVTKPADQRERQPRTVTTDPDVTEPIHAVTSS